MPDTLSLLVTSYGVHDAVHAAASPELSAWLDSHARKWKIQVKWNLPLADDGLLDELAVAVGWALAMSSGKRSKTIQSLLNKLNEGRGLPPAQPTADEVVAELAKPVSVEPEAALEEIAGDLVVQADQADQADQAAPAGVPAEAVAVVEVTPAVSEALAPKAPLTLSEPAQASAVPMAALVSSGRDMSHLRRLEPEESPMIPPPERRAAAMLGALFHRIKSGQ
jgi:hypothetical protein